MDWQSESPELWAFLKSLHRGEILTGTVAAIERFGVFVALDDGPDHPTLPGVGFIVGPELSWGHIDAPADVVEVGQRVSCEFLQFDTSNAEARLSLKALRPDPFQAFADRTAVGRQLCGRVEKVVPFGALVDLGDGIVGLVPFREVQGRPAAGRPEDFEIGKEVSVVVTNIERPARRVLLSTPEDARHAGVVPPMRPSQFRVVDVDIERGDLTDVAWERLWPFLPAGNGRSRFSMFDPRVRGERAGSLPVGLGGVVVAAWRILIRWSMPWTRVRQPLLDSNPRFQGHRHHCHRRMTSLRADAA